MRGDGRVCQRGGIWYACYYVDGREVRESSKSPDEEAAWKLLRRRLRERAVSEELGRPFIGPEQKRVRVSELLDAFEKDAELRGLRGLDRLRSHVKQVRDTFGDWRAVKMTPRAIDNYVADCLEDGVRPATVNRRLQVLSQSFRLAVERGVLATGPRIRRLSEAGNARQGFFEPDQVEAVVERLPEHLKDLVRFAALCGWRRREIVSLNWSDVDVKGGVIRLRPENSKTGEGRLLVLEGELREVIERRLRARQVETPGGETMLAAHVFHKNGEPVGDFRKAWESACAQAGLGELACRTCGKSADGHTCKDCKAPTRYRGRLFHDLRRSAVRNLVRAGVPERVAMMVSGHKTRSIFDRYNIVAEADLRAAMQKQEAYLTQARAASTVVEFQAQKGQDRGARKNSRTEHCTVALQTVGV
ncbi:MAG: site-specific integrase [Acidobacteria bacterium]|nr:site-specific integrase [Acidobacteriota bacterium]